MCVCFKKGSLLVEPLCWRQGQLPLPGEVPAAFAAPSCYEEEDAEEERNKGYKSFTGYLLGAKDYVRCLKSSF